MLCFRPFFFRWHKVTMTRDKLQMRSQFVYSSCDFGCGISAHTFGDDKGHPLNAFPLVSVPAWDVHYTSGWHGSKEISEWLFFSPKKIYSLMNYIIFSAGLKLLYMGHSWMYMVSLDSTETTDVYPVFFSRVPFGCVISITHQIQNKLLDFTQSLLLLLPTSS